MKLNPNIYNKIVAVSNEVQRNLRRKGVVIPTRNQDGSISLGSYTIRKDHEEFYIHDEIGEIVIKNINLPQTAVLLANNLALGKQVDRTLINKDMSYGSALFEEELAKRSAKKSKNIDKWDLMNTKSMIAQARKNHYKNEIVNSFKNFENSYK